MLGGHCIKTWSASQGAYALSSAEADLYGMVEGITKAKGLRTLAVELGFVALNNVGRLGTDSAAAKTFVNRRGVGKMRHLQIRDLWLQEEVEKGMLEVVKAKGNKNPADLMTKILTKKEICERLGRMNITVVLSDTHVGSVRSAEKHFGANEVLNFSGVAVRMGTDRIFQKDQSSTLTR